MRINNKEIIIEIDYEGEEIIRRTIIGFERISLFKRVFYKPQNLIFTIFNILFCFAFFYLLGFNNFKLLLLSTISALLLIRFLPDILFRTFSVIIVFLEDKYRKSGKQPVSLSKIFYFSDSGIRVTGDAKNFNLHWSEVTEAIETEKDFVVFIDDGGNCLLFPKRIFITFEEMKSFKDFLRQKISSKVSF